MVQHLVNKDWFNTPPFIRIYFNDEQKIRLLFRVSLGRRRRDPHSKLFAQLKIESHDCKWKNQGHPQWRVIEDISAATSDQGSYRYQTSHDNAFACTKNLPQIVFNELGSGYLDIKYPKRYKQKN